MDRDELFFSISDKDALQASEGTSTSRIPRMAAYVYMLCCADDSYYVGTTRDSLEKRVGEHQAGTFDGYTASRRPVRLVFYESFDCAEDAIAVERQIKGWRREKKEALIRGDYQALRLLARRGSKTASRRRPSFETAAPRPPQDEVP